MFKDIVSNDLVKEFLQKELDFNRKAGTYLFYGIDNGLLKRFAKAFAKGLNCSELKNDFCGKCENCIRIESETHGDLEILEDPSGVKVDSIRALAYKDSITSYEGKNKIYIINNIEKMRKEAANALLKMIEEPNDGSFFILLSGSLNILPTIKSRSILINIKSQTKEDLEVSLEEYSFFQGKALEIEKFKERTDIDLEEVSSYENIGENLKKWLDTEDLIYKVEIYKNIRDFMNIREYLTLVDKSYFIEEILKNSGNREDIKLILDYSINLIDKKSKKLEEILEIKNIIKTPINLKNYLTIFFNKI